MRKIESPSSYVHRNTSAGQDYLTKSAYLSDCRSTAEARVGQKGMTMCAMDEAHAEGSPVRGISWPVVGRQRAGNWPETARSGSGHKQAAGILGFQRPRYGSSHTPCHSTTHLVPMEGVEPTHSCEYQILSLARLPI